MIVEDLLTWVSTLGQRCWLLSMHLWIGREHRYLLHLMMVWRLLVHDIASTVVMMRSERMATLIIVFCCSSIVWFITHIRRCDGHITDQIDLVFFGGTSSLWIHLYGIELMLAHNSFSNVHSVHVAPIADVPEPKIQVVALETDPVTNSLHLIRLFGSNIWLNLSSLLQLLLSLMIIFTANL